MKAKVNIPARGKSNPPFKNLPPSNLLEEQTKKMEQQLQELKEVMTQNSLARGTLDGEGGSRWQSANTTLPIKNYAKTVIETKIKAPLNIISNKLNSQGTIMKPRKEIYSREVSSSREKLAPITGGITSNGKTYKNQENRSQTNFFNGTILNETNSNPLSNSKTLTSENKVTSKSQKPMRTEDDDVKLAENNLKKALLNQKEKNEVEKFLKEAGLPQYVSIFKENGFDDLETILEIQTKHLVDMKIPAGHQIKLSKRIESMRQGSTKSQTPVIPRQKTVQETETFSNGINIDHLKLNSQGYYGQKGSDYIQLSGPTKETGIGNERTGGELLQGTFNETESHQSFLEALNEWRAGKKKETTPTAVTGKNEKREINTKELILKKVRFAEPVKKKEEDEDEIDYISTKSLKKKEENKIETKSFFFAGGSSWNPSDVNHQKESGTEMSPRGTTIPKVSCWNCFSLIPHDKKKLIGNKQFCSDQCIKAYKDLHLIPCQKKACKKTFLKEIGVIVEGKWYCSEECCALKGKSSMDEQKKLERDPNKEIYKDKEINLEIEECGEDFELDLSVNLGHQKEILTLAELEEKYKNVNHNNIIERK